MKNIKKFTFLIFILILLGFTGCKSKCSKCDKNPVDIIPPANCIHVDANLDYICDLCSAELEKPVVEQIIDVQAIEKSIEIKDEKVNSYDFKQLFKITVNSENITILDEYIDKTSLNIEPLVAGTYTVTCTYEDKSASVEVIVLETVYEITLETEEITINKNLVSTYDFISLFKVYKDGKKLNITDKMITSNVIAEEGTYEFTIAYKTTSKTLVVNVTNAHKLEIIPAYKVVTISISDLILYDFTKLFNIYLDGQIQVVEDDMLSFTTINDPIINNEYTLEITYQYESDKVFDSIKIKVVEDDEIVINCKNIVIYPNQEQIDLRTLFTITKGNKTVDVTYDMISGSIDYNNEGLNEITINYQDQTAVSTVEIKRGVIIDYSYSDTMVITKGTNQDSYNFMNDFKVLINGVLFTNLSSKYIKESNVDFNTPGEYALTISIPYNDKKFGLSGVKFEYFEKTITYLVVENEYQIKVNNDYVVLPKGTLSYDPFENLTVYINNKKQKLTTIKEYVDSITCYANIISESIDYNSVSMQQVTIEVYANGVNNDPIIVNYDLIIESDIIITVNNKSIYRGDTLYPNELFEITKGSENIQVTADMITGILDVFTPGKYSIEINYEGINAVANVVVLDDQMKGNYITNTDIFYKEEVIEDDYGDFGDYGDIDFYSLDNSSAFEKQLRILDDGTILFGNTNVEIIKGIDQNTFVVKIKSYEYMLYYNDGIIVLDPNNDIKLTYNEDKMPMVFFNTNKWILEDKICINYSKHHVTKLTYISYSIDAYKITSVETGESKWYGMKISLVDKTSSDTVYTVEWDELTFSEGFEPIVNTTGTVNFKNQIYTFTMTDENVAISKVVSETKEYANKIFTGTFKGQNAELRVNEHEAYSLYANGKLIVNTSIADINKMTNGGTNHSAKTVFIYGHEEGIYSYKFIVNPDDLTFEYIEKDSYYGFYKTDGMYIFIDGYGTGYVNFNTKSFYNYNFTYDVNDGTIVATFINTKPTFAYGENMKLYIPEFKNLLEIKYCYDHSYEGIVLENADITTGAIVRIDSYQVGQDSDAVAKAQLLNNIHIITKDDELTYDEKINCIDTSKIRFNTPGFYQMTITINVDGKDITQYYAVEVLEAIYTGNPVIGSYGCGIIYDQYSLDINRYGQATIVFENQVYKGTTIINDDYSFVINAYDSNSRSIKITGYYVAEGLILVKCTGNLVFNDYFTKGKVNIIGTTGCYLREIIINNVATYIYASDKTLLGEIVDVNLINGTTINAIGSIIEINTSDKIIYTKIVSWNNIIDGLILSDKFRGTYTNELNEIIVLDGFGLAQINDVYANYILNGRVGILTTADNTIVCNFNPDTHVFTKLNIKLDNSLVSGRTYTAHHTFYCGYYAYTAKTQFKFKDNSEVIVYSVSDNHDSGSDACTEDIYEAPYASKDGVKGTYSVSGTTLTIIVNGYTLIFTIDDVVNSSQITCRSTTLSKEEHGYIPNNTIFTKE